MIKKILVAVDGSDHANRALNFALDLADRYFAEIQVLTVVPPVFVPFYSFYVLTESATEISRQLEASFKGALSKAIEKVKKEKPNLKASIRLEKGYPDEKIVETAKRGDFDIIIMGSRGLGHRNSALGSVSGRVVDRAPCAVVVVK